MQEKLSELWPRAETIFVTSLFVLFMVMLPRYTDAAKSWFALLIITALVYLLANWRLIIHTCLAERIFFAAIVANFLWIVFGFYLNGEPGRGANFVWGRHFYFLFLIPLFFLFRKIEISDIILTITVVASVVLSQVDMLIDIAKGVDHRLQGMNPNAFGPIQLCLSGILLLLFFSHRNTGMRWLALVGFVVGLTTVVYSQSRTTWVTLVVLGIMLSFYLCLGRSRWKTAGAAIGIMLLLASSYLLPMVQVRIDNAISNTASYFSIDNHQASTIGQLGSIGVRLELWKTAWQIFLENPITGVGVGGFKPTARANSARYQVSPVVHQYKYVHNQYLVTLASRGLPGLMLFLAVLLIPIYMAMSQKSAGAQSKLSGAAILLLSVIYIIGCLAEDHFETKPTTMFVCVMLAFLMARLSNARLKEGTDK